MEVEVATLYECETCGGKVSGNAKVCPHCGEDGGLSAELLKSESKSRITSFVLTLLFGPIGLLYSSVLWGVILTLVAIVGATTIIIPVIIWIISILMGDSLTYGHNKKIKLLAGQLK